MPFHKGEIKADARDYKPVSLTSNRSQVIGYFIKKKLITFLEENNLLRNTIWLPPTLNLALIATKTV